MFGFCGLAALSVCAYQSFAALLREKDGLRVNFGRKKNREPISW